MWARPPGRKAPARRNGKAPDDRNAEAADHRPLFVQRLGRGRLHIGYLGQRGKARWCFPTEQMTSDGFDVYDAEIEPLPDLATDRVAYLLQTAEGGPLSYDDGGAS